MRTTRLLIPVAATTLLVACGDDSDGPAAPTPPVIQATSVVANPRNVLSAVVSVQVTGADSVAVRFRASGALGADSVTPVVATSNGTVEVPVLGLKPATRYAFRAIAAGRAGTVVGDAVELTTGELPSDLPRFSAGGPDPTPGYVVFAAGLYGIVIDNTGRVVWYRHFPNGLGLSFAAQPVGRYAARLVTPDATDVEPWVEIDALGNFTRTLGCARGLVPRFHDLLVERDGGYWIMCDETKTMDLSAIGGVPGARVTGTAVQRMSPAGALEFHWSAFDHLAIADVDAEERTTTAVNWTHGNAIDVDTDGNLLVSFRNLNEVTKIDASTGAVIWRLGGRRNQFTFLDTPTPAFTHQHSVRADARGSLILFDNIGSVTESHGERYVLDERAMTARLASSYAALPRAVSAIGGSTQLLPGGRTLVSYGQAGRVEEYDSSGRVVWRIEGNAGYVFRAQRIPSLYTPGVGATR
jgi:hypothetical protein